MMIPHNAYNNLSYDGTKSTISFCRDKLKSTSCWRKCETIEVHKDLWLSIKKVYLLFLYFHSGYQRHHIMKVLGCNDVGYDGTNMMEMLGHNDVSRGGIIQ
ncbi:hypothetical protein WUBG_11152 [Wuchereria bancrofti]|uniref:Uncharacterized protein n=1 Tax=Wuchereria bancrofti TaxID=6293 RepID=J9E712_WUCBA|nr:hypothetical protein WUBG_11152 [Wuchereria bancrofti]